MQTPNKIKGMFITPASFQLPKTQPIIQNHILKITVMKSSHKTVLAKNQD